MTPRNRRILVVDDNAAIHSDFRKILARENSSEEVNLAEMEANLFGANSPGTSPASEGFIIESAYQGDQGVRLVEEAVARQEPYAVAFIDVRMPPGWDGIETTERLWRVDPNLLVVICTAYSDYSLDAMVSKLGITDRLVILKKPFDAMEVEQLAHVLTETWRAHQDAALRMDELEALVRKRTISLRQEISRRKQIETELERARDFAEAATRAKSEFLANMSHELRTPMNGVFGMCQLLMSSDDMPADLRDLVKTLASSGEILLGMIDDVLDFSKIEANKLSLECAPFSLREAVSETLELLSSTSEQKNLELLFDIAPDLNDVFLGDSTRLRQVLLNLVGNAIKFTSIGEVLVRVTRADRDDDDRNRIQIHICDTGIGLDEKSQLQLFEPFTQADNSITRRFGGTGLGLAICKRLVDLMDGSIAVESEVGKGSVFTIELPLPPAPGTPAPAPVSLGDEKILVADDNATNREILKRLITTHSAQVETASDAATARQAIVRAANRGEPFSVAILDGQMPDENGLSLAKDLKRQTQHRPPKIILLSSHQARPSPDQLTTSGIASCLFKPVRPKALIKSIRSLLDHPAAPVPSPPPSEPAKNETPSTARLLVAEDNAVNQKVALLLLKKLGYTADVVGNGREAVEAIKTRTYDLILMDCQMPELDGFEATRIIRDYETENATPRIPIVAMTAGTTESYRQDCIDSGMDDYIAKPVRREELDRIILALLNSNPTSLNK